MSAIIDKLPTITIPATTQRDSYGTPIFFIDTPRGEIKVEVGRCRELWCTGSPEAVIGYGLTRPEWLPGLPGNNPTAQRVVFDTDGPRLIVGKPIGKRPNKQTLITIQAWGFIKRTVRVRIPMSAEQMEFYRLMMANDDGDDAADTADATQSDPLPRQIPQYHHVGNVFYLQPRT